MYKLSILLFFVLFSPFPIAADPLVENDNYATVYVMRNDDNHKPVASTINVNGDFHGSTFGETYLVLRLPEGSHSISGEMNNLSDLEIKVEASKTYFIQQKISSNLFSPKNKLVQVDVSKGLELMWMCTAVDSDSSLEVVR
jgi:hypothetical protein